MFKSALLATAFAALIAICAQVSVPMVPVPMTLQTWAVLLAGLVLGVRWGAASVALYLLAAAAGLPVLSDGRSGLDALTGPTAGYLAAFPIVAGLAGAMRQSARFRHPWIAIAGLTGLHAMVLALGAAWLARSIGVEAAVSGGLLPFLPGAIVKSGAAWLAWKSISSRLVILQVKRGGDPDHLRSPGLPVHEARKGPRSDERAQDHHPL